MKLVLFCEKGTTVTFAFKQLGAAAVSIALSMQSGGALAGPDDTTNRFLNDSPSMMDWGIYRLQEMLKTEEGSDVNLNVSFNWDRNLVIVETNVYHSKEDVAIGLTEIGYLKGVCQNWFDVKRFYAGVNGNGSLINEREISLFASQFMHIGFFRTINGVDDKEALKELEKKLFMKMTHWRATEDDAGFVPLISCSGYLLSNRVAYEE